MPSLNGKTVLATLALVVAIGGTAYAAFDNDSLVGPLLIVVSIIFAWELGRAYPDLAAALRPLGSIEKEQRARRLGDLLLVTGCVIALVCLHFFKTETLHDRGVALLFPTIIFGAGILCKIYYYLGLPLLKILRERSRQR